MCRSMVDLQSATAESRRGIKRIGLDKSRTGQLAVSQMPPKRKTKHAKSPMASASCPVRDLSSKRVGSPRVGVSASCTVTVWSTLRRYYTIFGSSIVTYHVRPHQPIIDHQGLGFRGLIHREAHPVIPRATGNCPFES